MEIQEIFPKFIQYSHLERGLSPRTLESYKHTIKLLFLFLDLEQTAKIEILTKDLIRSFLYYGRTERNWSPKTYIIHFHNLKIFIRFLLTEEILTTDPMQTLEKPKCSKTIIQPLSKDEVFKILYCAMNHSAKYKYSKLRNYAMFSLSLHSGLRLSEILNLQIFDINFEQKILHVRKGKGDKDRLVAIPNELISLLKNFLIEREKSFSEIFTAQLFCTSRGKNFLVRDFHRIIEKVKELTKIHFSAHDFRRTYATTLSRKGISPFIIQQQLGHTNIKTTMRYVVHNLEDCKNALQNLVLY
ncbi:MAG: tyrosine-type recombinase/integrase [Candidatus Peregrinibacteria bacterium]